MKYLALVALLFAIPAQADTISPITYTSLAGTIKSPGETITYSFFVESFTNDGQGEAILNGSWLDKGSGATTSQKFTADYFFFPADGSLVLTEFGRLTHWDLIATWNNAYLVDPPISTPEPSTLFLLLSLAAMLVSALAMKAMYVRWMITRRLLAYRVADMCHDMLGRLA